MPDFYAAVTRTHTECSSTNKPLLSGMGAVGAKLRDDEGNSADLFHLYGVEALK